MQLLYSYLSEFWKIPVSQVQEEFSDGLWTVTEDSMDPERLIVQHQSREDLVVIIDELG